MTMHTLEYIGHPKKLTLDFMKCLDIDKVIYAERSSAGAMGVPGNLEIHVLDSNELTVYRLIWNPDNESEWSEMQNILATNEERFNFYHGGMGNEVFFKKDITIKPVHYTGKHKRDNSHFIVVVGNTKCIIRSSVYGVFAEVSKQLKSGYDSSTDPLRKAWLISRNIGKIDTKINPDELVAYAEQLANYDHKSATLKPVYGIGAVIGDIVGSVHEFHGIKNKEFEYLSDQNFYTDDTVLTLATVFAVVRGGKSEDFVRAYQDIGREHMHCSYGERFVRWLISDKPQPYDSYGNGSAMRVSPIGWLYENLEDVEHMAEVSASVTHNHPEGIKGAQATAVAIFMARTGSDKEDIKKYITKRYGYDLDFTLDEIRADYAFDESCQGTVPQAIVAFLESNSFEDAIRGAISLGGDADTLASITGSIADAYYGLNETHFKQIMPYLTGDLVHLIKSLNRELVHRELVPSDLGTVFDDRY